MSVFLSLILAGCSDVRPSEAPTSPPAPPTEQPSNPTPIPTVPPPADCAAPPGIQSPVLWAPTADEFTAFQPRSSGAWLWADNGGILTGDDRATATVEVDTPGSYALAIREDDRGIAWLSSETGAATFTLMHRAVGGSPVELAVVDVQTQFDLHTNGAVVFTRGGAIGHLDGTGQETGLVAPSWVFDVAYGVDEQVLWVASADGLVRWAVDTDGLPDGSPAEFVTGGDYQDIEVDACGFVYGIRPDTPFDLFGERVLERVHPSGQVELASGRREFMGNLRFGRGPDEETMVHVTAGDYNSDPTFIGWDVGIPERPR